MTEGSEDNRPRLSKTELFIHIFLMVATLGVWFVVFFFRVVYIMCNR